MTTPVRRRGMLAIAVATCLVGTTALAAQPQEKRDSHAAKRAAFLRGDASSKAPRIPAPKNEAEAIAAKRVLANGIIEIQLPADRMLELTAIKRADGTVEVRHIDLDQPVAEAKEISLD